MTKIERLKRRADFLAVAGQRRKYVAPGLILQACRRQAAEPVSSRVGFTASRKVGISVERNRARRRLKAAARQVLERHAASGHDYVVIARAETLSRKFPDLLLDLETAMKRLGAWEEQGG
jgi:ribonuclease P protein component